MSKGFLYTAYGKAHVGEAIKSVESLKKVHPESHVTLVTTGTAGRGYDFGQFNRVITSPHLFSEFLGGKVERMYSFYNKTIYLDTDTYICKSLDPLFDLLGPYDIVVCPDPGEVEINGLVAPSTGVMAFDSNVRVERLFDLYRTYYFEKELWKAHPGRKQRTDQPAFAQALRDSNAKALWVPCNWNFRYRFWTHLHKGPVRVIHGLDCNYEDIQNLANAILDSRVWNPGTKEIVG